MDPDSRKPNTKNNPLPTYNNVPPPNRVGCIDSGVTEDKVWASFTQEKLDERWGPVDYDLVEEEEAFEEAWNSFPDMHDVPRQEQEYVEDL